MDRPATGRYSVAVRMLGIDVGARRIGLALSDPSGALATPLGALAPPPRLETQVEAVVREIDRLARDESGLGGVVVGMPRGLDGRPHAQTARVAAFVEALRRSVGLPVAAQDERLTSREAERRLALRENDWRRRKRKLDAAAAAVILQDYLDARPPWPAEAGGGR